MHRIDHATRAEDLHGAGKDGYTEGDPIASIAPTVVTADALNAIQEEIANVIEAAGGTLSKPDNTQLNAAIPTLLQTQGPAASGKRYATMLASRSNLSGSNAAAQWSQGVGGAGIRSEVNSGQCTIPIDGSDIPHGVTLTALYIMWKQGATRASASNRLAAWIGRYAFDWSVAATGFATLNGTVFITAANTAVLQVDAITPSDFPLVHDREKPFEILLKAGNDGGTNKDLVYAISVEWNDPVA